MKSKNILKNLSAIGLSDVIGTGATAFFWFYLASVISPENYGEIFFYLGIATLISSIVLNPETMQSSTLNILTGISFPLSSKKELLPIFVAINPDLFLMFIFIF